MGGAVVWHYRTTPLSVLFPQVILHVFEHNVLVADVALISAAAAGMLVFREVCQCYLSLAVGADYTTLPALLTLMVVSKDKWQSTCCSTHGHHCQPPCPLQCILQS